MCRYVAKDKLYNYKQWEFLKSPHGRFAKPCRALSPACVLTSPTARH